LRSAKLLWSTPDDHVFDWTHIVLPSALMNRDGMVVP
jgi:hypothetical protein